MQNKYMYKQHYKTLGSRRKKNISYIYILPREALLCRLTPRQASFINRPTLFSKNIENHT